MRLGPELMAELRGHAEQGYPHETCGIFLGRPGKEPEALEFHPVPNVVTERTHDRYLIDPLTQLRIEKSAWSRGLEIVGFYHSHPDHPARPSQFDTEHAWPFWTYVVVSVERGKLTQATAWQLNETARRFEEVPLEVSQDSVDQPID
jgi:proteasome lid subunit RPN8/RPN11